MIFVIGKRIFVCIFTGGYKYNAETAEQESCFVINSKLLSDLTYIEHFPFRFCMHGFKSSGCIYFSILFIVSKQSNENNFHNKNVMICIYHHVLVMIIIIVYILYRVYVQGVLETLSVGAGTYSAIGLNV